MPQARGVAKSTVDGIDEMRIVIIGAGVIGSFNALRLAQAGHDVTLLARGQRLADLREHGVVLEEFRSERRIVRRVAVVERLEPDDDYELALVPMRRNQIPSILPVLAQNRRIPSILFLGNNAAGVDDIVAAVGRERVLLGMGNAGGARDGYVVRYLWWSRLPLRFGELDGARTARTEAIVKLYRSAGLRARAVKNIDAYLKTHAAGLPALAGAVYFAGGNVCQLAESPEGLRLFIRAFREALRALHATGVPLKPGGTALVEWIPEKVLAFCIRPLFKSRLAAMGAQPHLDAAVDEMKELADELRVILRQAGLPTPASDVLFARVDAQFATTVPH